ncbi:glycosyltransferase family 2 protein [Effusibacillus dendaii]|uniref:Glycosyltransferase 2-like domain-containing protein n=1 Tax=Effusibacillus dendaii TaxID=2743772 RepID=A0A7I8DGR1_9BACL|nr:glycosyltransferase family 2 protein [Effusibacillus dendaii]BCJ88189.1 hypothetical protein skT53_31740 [Effusibacillus dendaii]
MSYRRIRGLVSVVVPAYNSARYIRTCINSLVKQSYPHIEIIIVNDASSDRTANVIQNWKKSTGARLASRGRIAVAVLPRNTGFSGAITMGMFLSEGEFIAIQDADDLSHPDRFKKQVQFLRDHPEVGLVGTNYAAFKSGSFKNQEIANWIRFGNEIKETYAAGGHCICHGTIMFRGSIFDQIGGPTRRIEGAEDYEFIVRCIENGITVENLPDVLYYYRNHALQRSRKYFGKTEKKGRWK